MAHLAQILPLERPRTDPPRGPIPELDRDPEPDPDGGPGTSATDTRARARQVLLAQRAQARRRQRAAQWTAQWVRERHHAIAQRAEAGLATAEYAIATVAAAGFAGLLITVLRSNTVRGLLTSIVESALSIS